MKFLIIHGYNDTGLKDWRKWLKEKLEQEGHQIFVPDMPNPSKPVYSEWISFLESNYKQDLESGELALIGHSLGGFVCLKLAERYKLKNIILIAPVGGLPKGLDVEKWIKEKNIKHLESIKFLQDAGSLNVKEISELNPRIFIFNSNIDKVINEKKQKMVKDMIDWARFMNLEKYGHFTGVDGCTKFPELYDLIKEEILKD